MENRILRKLFLGFIQIHILYHAQKEPLYGVWMIDELNRHGYEMSPGTLYPLLHRMESSGLLKKEEKAIDGKIRKYYQTTKLGNQILDEARIKAYELYQEIK